MESVYLETTFISYLVARPTWEDSVIWEDPIVAEVNQIREKLAAEYNFDVKAIFADLRKRQASLGARLVQQKNRAEPTAAADRGGHSDSSRSSSSEAAPAG